MEKTIEELRKEAAYKKYPEYPNDSDQTQSPFKSGDRNCHRKRKAFIAGAEWEAEREKSVSVDKAKSYTYEWLKNKGLTDCGIGLDFDDIFHLMADFANTKPSKNK